MTTYTIFVSWVREQFGLAVENLRSLVCKQLEIRKDVTQKQRSAAITSERMRKIQKLKTAEIIYIYS